MIQIALPSRALVILVGSAGSGKSTFAERHFPPTSIVSSDLCREMVSDDVADQSSNKAAFELYHLWIEARLAHGRITVADATNLWPSSRAILREIAARHKTPAFVFEFVAPIETCIEQNNRRIRRVPIEVMEKHAMLLVQAQSELRTETYAQHFRILSEESYRILVSTAIRDLTAPGFDIIGDIHGCSEELDELLTRLGYERPYVHPAGRKLVFLGDYTDRGPDSLSVLRTVRIAIGAGNIGLMGNHDNKLMRALKGNKVQMAHGLTETMRQLNEGATPEERIAFFDMLSNLAYQALLTVPGHIGVIACHAGLPKRLIGVDTSESRNFAIYGEVEGKPVKGQPPVRGKKYIDDWPRGGPILVHGHDVVVSPVLRDDAFVFDIDTGVPFGGALTAFRWPEGEFTQVQAKRVYSERLARTHEGAQ
jgi:protein phosphatase